MLNLPSIFDILVQANGYKAEDLVDRLNYVATVFIIGFFVIITGSEQHFGTPIQCMTPAESTQAWVDYYHGYCYIQEKLKVQVSTSSKHLTARMTNFQGRSLYGYNQAPNEMSTTTTEPVTESRVMYYQWVPYALFVQALCFLLPKLFWRTVGAQLCQGMELDTAVSEACKLNYLDTEEKRNKKVECLVQFIHDVLDLKKSRSVIGPYSSLMCYTATKWLSVLNVFLQLYMMTHFIGNGNHLWGWTLLSAVLEGDSEPYKGMFPRVVICETHKFELAAVHPHFIQCLLLQNFLNEKVFTFLWFWMIFVAMISLLSALKYTFLLSFSFYRNGLADSLLPSQEVLFSSAVADLGVHPSSPGGRHLIEYFFENVLRADGILLLSFINISAGGMVTHDIAHQLWKITVQQRFSLKVGISESLIAANSKTHLLSAEDSSTTRHVSRHRLPNAANYKSLTHKNHFLRPVIKGKTPLVIPQLIPIARQRTRSLSVGNLEQLHTLLPSGSERSDIFSGTADTSLPFRRTLPPSPMMSPAVRIPMTLGERSGPGVAIVDNRRRI